MTKFDGVAMLSRKQNAPSPLVFSHPSQLRDEERFGDDIRWGNHGQGESANF